MADERRSRPRFQLVISTLVYALVIAEAFAAALSLVAGDPWDWGRFWWMFVLVLLSSVASSAGEALARGGALGSMSPQAQRKHDEGEETAQAVRTGMLPPDASPDQWQDRIRRHIRQTVVMGTFCTVLCVTATVLTATAARLNNEDNPVLWTLAAVTVLVLVPLRGFVVRDRRRVDRLMARL